MPDDHLTAPAFHGGEQDAVWWVRGRDPTRCVLAFAGYYRGINGHPVEFRRWSETTACSWVFVRDLRNSWYLRGVSDALPTPGALLDYLAALLRDLAPARTVVVGTSAGGWAALWYGTLLHAHRVVGLAAVTRLSDPRFQHEIDPVLAYPGVSVPELRALLLASDPRTQYDLHACADEVADVAHAQHLAGLPRVRVHLHPCAQHNVAWFLRDTGALAEHVR